jgi:CheY-like chemotaxis protein
MTEVHEPSRTVLVVEDEALVAMLFETILTGAGYRPVWAPSGRCALLAGPGPVAASAASAVVVNLRLASGRDGRDLIRRLREERPGMPAVVVTGYNPRAPQADLRGLGGPTIRLGKPIESDALLDQLAGLLDRSALLTPPRRRLSDLQPAQEAA